MSFHVAQLFQYQLSFVEFPLWICSSTAQYHRKNPAESWMALLEIKKREMRTRNRIFLLMPWTLCIHLMREELNSKRNLSIYFFLFSSLIFPSALQKTTHARDMVAQYKNQESFHEMENLSLLWIFTFNVVGGREREFDWLCLSLRMYANII